MDSTHILCRLLTTRIGLTNLKYLLITLSFSALATDRIQVAALFKAEQNNIARVMKSGDFYDLKNANRVPAALARFNQPVPDMLGAQGSAAHAAAQLKIIAPGQPSNFSSMANAHARGFQQKIGAGPGRVVTGAQIKVTRDQNILNIFNHIKHSEPIYNARHAMLHQEVKHAATALRQFNAVHQTRLQPQNICPAIQSFNNLSNLTISARPLNDLLKKAIHDIQKKSRIKKAGGRKFGVIVAIYQKNNKNN